MPRRVGQYRACRNAADLHAQGFGAVGVGQRGGDLGQFDRPVLLAFVELVAHVVTVTVAAMQVGYGDAGVGQVGKAGVQRHGAGAQVLHRPAVDRQVDVKAARPRLVGLVDLKAVVTGGGWRERAAELAAVGAPQTAGNVFTANVDHHAVIGDTAEGVALARFHVDQAGDLGTRTGGDVVDGLDVGHHGGVVGGARVVDGFFQYVWRSAIAVVSKAGDVVPALFDQPGRGNVVVRHAEGRCVGHWGDIHFHRGAGAQVLAIGWLELELRVIRLLVTHASAAITVGAGLVGVRRKAQLAAIDLGLGKGLAAGHVGPGAAVRRQVLQLAGYRQLGDFHPEAGLRRVHIAHAEVGPGQGQRGVFRTGHGTASGHWRIVDRYHVDGGGGHVGVVAAIGHRHGDGARRGARVVAVVGERDVLDTLHVVSQRRAAGQRQGNSARLVVGADADAIHAIAQVQGITSLRVGQRDRRARQQCAVWVSDLDIRVGDRHARPGGTLGKCRLVIGTRGAAGVVGIQVDHRRRIVVEDVGGDGAFVDHQVLEVASGDLVDGDNDLFRRLGDLVVERADIKRHAAGACRDLHGVHAGEVRTVSGGAAVFERHGHVGLRRVGQGQGVVGGATFSDRTVARNADFGISHYIRDLGDRGAAINNQMLVLVATADHAGDLGADIIGADIGIVRCGSRREAGGLATADGDGRAVIQPYHQVGAHVVHGRAVLVDQGRGVDDLPAFADRASGLEYHGHVIDGVVDGGRGARRCDGHTLEIAAGGAGDLDGLGALVDEHVIGRRRDGHRAHGLTLLDGDARTVVELDQHVAAGLVAQGGGVGDLAAFVDRGRGSQGDGGQVGGAWCVGDGGVHRRRARHQVLEVLAAGHAFDGGGDGLVAFVDVVWRYGGDGTARLIHTDGDGLAIVQGDGQRIGDVGHRCAVFIHKAGGVDDVAAFADGGGGGQDHIDFVDGVVDRGGGAIAGNFEFFEVAAGGLGDLDGLGALIDKHVIGRRRDSDGANSFAGLNGDA